MKTVSRLYTGLIALLFLCVLLTTRDAAAQALSIATNLAIPFNPVFSNGAAQVAFAAMATGGNPGNDYTLFYLNRQATIEKVRAAIMLPANVSARKSGYEGTFINEAGVVSNQGTDNLIEYDHFCCSFNDGCTLMDPCLTIGATLDFLNALVGIHSTAGLTARNLLDTTPFVAGVGSTLTNCSNGNCIPAGVTYPHPYAKNDRRETLFGSLYGNIPDAIHGSGGYIFMPGRNNLDAGSALPTIEMEIVANDTNDYTHTDFSKTNGLPAPNVLCPWILLNYLRGTPNATNVQNAIVSLFNDWNPTFINSQTGSFQNYNSEGIAARYGFALHMMRATGAWNWPSNTVRGQSYQTVAAQVAAALDGLVQGDGSIIYSYGSDKTKGPEQIGMYLCSADPRVPNNFGITNQNYQWEWDFGDGSPNSFSQCPVHAYTGSVTTNYSVIITATDQNGASSTNELDLTIQGTLPTSPPTIACSVSGNNFTLSWPGNYVGWILQSQTGNLSGTNWADVTGTATTNMAMFLIDTDNPTVFYRLRYPSP